MLERKEETKLVKTTLAKLGYQDVKVTHGRGTAWGWVTVDVSVPKPSGCSCDTGDPNRYPFYCTACKEAMHTNRIKVTDIILDTTGRRRGEYDGNTIVDITFTEVAELAPIPMEEPRRDIRATKISDNVLAIISAATVDGPMVILNSGQLDRAVYVAVNKVLEGMGGKWNRKAGGHVFDNCPTEKLEAIILTGEYNRPADYGYFPTPLTLVDELVCLAGVYPGMKVLEPSAGRGAILERVAPLVGQMNVDCYELLPENAADLGGNLIECCDFLTVTPRPCYDRVIMNPPFSRQEDIDHVTHALKFLKPGGRLVSVMSAGVKFRTNKKTVEFLEKHQPVIKDNPPETFKVSGTMVNTVTVVIERGSAGRVAQHPGETPQGRS